MAFAAYITTMQMNIRAQWTAFLATGTVALISDLTWMVLSPLYEESISIFVTPLLSFLGVVFFTLYLRRSLWAYQCSPYYGAGTGMVMALFIGDSAKFYGKYAVAMNVVEAGVLVSSAALIAVYFLPAIREYFRAAEINKTVEPTR
jgi:hypothetical protein